MTAPVTPPPVPVAAIGGGQVRAESTGPEAALAAVLGMGLAAGRALAAAAQAAPGAETRRSA